MTLLDFSSHFGLLNEPNHIVARFFSEKGFEILKSFSYMPGDRICRSDS